MSGVVRDRSASVFGDEITVSNRLKGVEKGQFEGHKVKKFRNPASRAAGKVGTGLKRFFTKGLPFAAKKIGGAVAFCLVGNFQVDPNSQAESAKMKVVLNDAGL